MMSAPLLVKSLVRHASTKGVQTLRQFHDELTGQLLTNGGRQLQSSSVNGASFSHIVAPGADVTSLLGALDEAIQIFDEQTENGTLADYLAARRAHRTKAHFA